MKVTITSRNFNPSDNLKSTIEGKMAKLDKYFVKDTEADVMVSNVKGSINKLEATIKAGGFIFRAEESDPDIYFCLDKVIDKLSSQMSRFKTKLLRRNKEQKEVFLADMPETVETAEASEISVVKTKRFTLNPMSTEEAIMQMELLAHSFFVFLDGETDSVNVVYKRADGSYGLLETTK